MVKKWEIIESRNRFYCDGRCLTGRDIGVFIFALVLITVISGLFFAFDCPYLARKLNLAVPVFAGLLYLCVISFIFRTACSDPGILPRATQDEVTYLERSNLTNGPQNVALPGRTMEVQMHTGHVLQLKFCATCKIFRPPRVSHCSLCNACIANFDHHCPWVGNCVGLRNYRYFYLFLLSLSILCIYIFVFNIVNIVLRIQENASSSFADAIRETPATVVEGIICFFSIWSVLGLWGYHTYLICRNVTTNEDIKNTWNVERPHVQVKNPFSKGNSCMNCFATLCGPLPPSLLNLRTTVQPDEQTMHRNNIDDRIRYQSAMNHRSNSTSLPPYSDHYSSREYV